MPRAIWTGSIGFGLVNVPVRMYAAIHEETVHFNLVHRPDSGPIGYEKICKSEGKPVADDEIVKAYPLDDDRLVLLDDEDFAAAAAETYKTIEILDFVPYEQIDPIYFERTYYLGPDKNAESVYLLLTAAMERSELAAIARYVFHDRERLGALRVREGVITLERMYFADEVRPAEGIAPKSRKGIDKRQLEMAMRLIEQQAGDFEPERYHDVYRERLLEIIERKARGETVEAAAPARPKAPDDLLDALRASLERAKEGGRGERSARASNGGRKRQARQKGGGSRADADGLADLTVSELRERARKADVPGRSKMGRKELIAALRAA
jgi:DNA end-binding protein Ku